MHDPAGAHPLTDDAEQLGRLAQVRDLGGRLALAGVERLLVAVDPDHRDLGLHARLDVVVVARRDVHPALLAADPPRALVEVRRVGLVGADLLRGDDEVEVERDVAPRLPEQLVVDVGDQAELVLLARASRAARRVSLNGRPALDRVGQEARARGLERPAEPLGDLDRGAAQDLGVELVGAALDLLREISWKSGITSLRSIVKPSRAASASNASQMPVSQSIRVP